MTWTDVPDFTAGQLVTETDMNTLRDNDEYLFARPRESYTLNEGANFSTSSTSFVNVDAVAPDVFELSIDTNGGDIRVHFHGTINPGQDRAFLDISLDGTRQGGDDGILAMYNSTVNDDVYFPVAFTRLLTGVAAGTHTVTLMWKAGSAGVTLYAGAGTANADIHPQFWIEEC